MRASQYAVLIAIAALAGSTGFMAAAQVADGPVAPAATAAPAPPAAGQGPGRGGGGRGGGRGGGQTVLDPAQIALFKASYVVPAQIPHPADNQPTPERQALGQKLFFDPMVSANGMLACASCHDARRGFTDGMVLSIGVKGAPLTRHTPAAMNLAFSPSLFWDGRADSLEQQALMPIANEDEMGMPHGVLVGKLRADPVYRGLFAAAYPGQDIDPITIGKAIAVFERALTFTASPFDRWLAGDETAISEAAKRGFVEFNGRAGCAQCHSGWNFTDGKFHDIGLATSDVGRFSLDPVENQRFAFKTPSLRNIADQAPYMHNGQFATLQQVVRFYNNGFIRRTSLAAEMRNVRTRGQGDLVAFLRTLSSPIPPDLIKAQEDLDRAVGKGGVLALATQ